MSKSDVVVIGNGFAGLIAALKSAENNKKVTLISYGSGTFPLSSGLVDILGYDEQGKAVKSPLAGVAGVPEDHPYKRIGNQSIQDAVKYFLDFTKKAGIPYVGSLDQQQWVVTAVGTMKPSCLVPESMQGNQCFNAKELVLVGVKGLKDFYVDMLKTNLQDWLGNDKKYSTVELDMHRKEGRDLTTLDVAHWMETEAGFKAAVSQIKSKVTKDAVVIVPPILGATGNAVYSKLVKSLGCAVVETTGMPPSVNGIRLREALLDAARKAGVRFIENAKAKSAIVEGSTVKAVMAGGEVRDQKYEADKFILATGGFYGAGLKMRDIGEFKEVVFGLPVEADCVEERWANEQLFSNQKQTFAKAGIKTDASLRAVDASGNVVLDNVYVVGRNLSGYDFCFEHSGNGVALSSAFKAALA